MTSSNIWDLAVAELVIFIALTPLVIFIIERHGRRGAEGWGFLLIFCILRLTSSGLAVGRKNSVSTTGSIINSIGVSGLLLTFSGILHEVSKCDVAHNSKLGLILSIFFHIMVVTGIVLAAIGGSNLAKQPEPGHDYSKDQNMQKVGYVILLLVVLLLAVYSIVLLFRLTRQRLQRAHSAMRLLSCTIAALIFGIVRVTYGLAATVTESSRLNPVTGIFAVKFVLIFLMQLIAALLLIVGGILSRDMRNEQQRAQEEVVQLGQEK